MTPQRIVIVGGGTANSTAAAHPSRNLPGAAHRDAGAIPLAPFPAIDIVGTGEGRISLRPPRPLERGVRTGFRGLA